MNPRSNRKYFLALFGILGFAAFVWLSPQVDPLLNVRMAVGREDVYRKASRIAQQWLSPETEHQAKLELICDRALLSALERRFGVRRANELLRDSVAVFRWQVKWTTSRSPFQFRGDVSEEQALEMVRSTLLGEFSIEMDLQGRIFSVNRRPSGRDSVRASFDPDQARPLAVSFLKSTVGLPDSLIQRAQVKGDGREVRGRPLLTLTITEQPPDVPLSVSHVVVVGRRGFLSYRREYVLPEGAPSASTQLESLFELIGLLGIGFLGLWYFIRRLRADQLDLAQGLPLGILAAVCVGIASYLNMSSGLLYSLVALVVIVPLVGFAVMALYSLSDSLGHDVWPEKVRSFNAFLRGVLLSKPLGGALLQGFAWAGIAGGLVRLYDVALLSSGKVQILLEGRQSLLGGPYPLVVVLAAATSLALIRELAFRNFAMSYLRRFARSAGSLVLAGFFVSFFDFVGLGFGDLVPYGAQILRLGVLGSAMTAALLWGDFVVPVAAAWVLSLFHRGLVFFAAGMQFQGAFVFALLLIVFGVAILAATRGVASDTIEKFEPAYIRRWAERERLQRELEIARHVQQTFLPADVPAFPGLDVASRCVPATEVGGDYYDLIPLGRSRLGVVIGDVSGKGIGAAFYMTLTKGFLRAHIDRTRSPKQALARVNELFYETAERGRFISMIYGVFDLDDRVFSFARAGHNPLLLRRSRDDSVERLAPSGMALGLARSELFRKVTVEEKVIFTSGDIFVFYTDGFSEAMTLEDIEYGEDRLAEALRSADPSWSAEMILDRLFTSVKRFVGSGKQHDDMTMVVVKIA